MSDLYALAVRLGKANHYTDIFTDPDTVKEDYRRLAVDLHPDKYDGNDKDVATEAFHILSVLKAEALQMLREDRWGERNVMATIRTRKATHEVLSRLGEDAMAIYFKALTTHASGADATVLKVAKSAKDNDLMAQEARALKKLHSEDHQLNRHFPQLYDSFLHSEGRRRSNVTERYDHFHPLSEIRALFPQGLDPRHGVWMFRRLLTGLGRAHDLGLVHGAVTPDNILIGAADHAVVLIDWCYSVVIDDESKTDNSIKAMVPMYKQFYPEEVLAKEPASPATDLYMAARLMDWLIPVAPKPFRAFFKGVALTKQSMRPQSAWLLLEEFDLLLKKIGEPFYPRRWVEFAVPTDTA